MEPVEVASYVIHSVFAGVWTGTVIFVTWAIVSPARNGHLNAEPLATVAGKLTTVSRLSALVLFLTGGHMAGVGYTLGRLTGTLEGYLVLAMLTCWFLLAGVVEVGASKLKDGTGRNKVRQPARESWRFFQFASVLAVLLLAIAGLLSASGSGFL